ncbi:MAG: DUF2061 domain-containing protein [Candidatus Omnitrophica bacterium]|nr:DUF2061 domain-containing protein [Candidatus Omnitrophota bacterium]MDD5512980.1 DUF2061 domain-containing protein [Candidatus Omnitrophota bacterium]
MEQRKRSILKSISWRIFSFMLTIIIIYAYTRNIRQALGVGAGIDLVKMILYYVHERLWNKVQFGRKLKQQDYQI